MGDADSKLSIVQKNSQEVAQTEKIVRFRGRPMVLVNDNDFDHYVPLHKERFDKIAYPILGGVSRSRVSDVFAYVANTADDLTHNEHLILFGTTAVDDETGKPRHGTPMVWDMRENNWMVTSSPTVVWRSPYAPAIPKKDEQGDRLPVQFIMDLAGGDQGVYDDIMQSIAPIIMDRKPDGVIWWVGDGANGKSTLMDALYRIFPGQFSSITVKRLVDGRDTPSLNGTLANIVKESSEGRVEDTEIYKAIGTHENFRVHRFHSQDDLEVRGNIHHIFSANSVPSFNDKGYSARRRTFIVPFKQRFTSDPSFEEKTFTPEIFGQLVTEMARYASRLANQGYKYKWSATTLAAKADYDMEANNAEEYVKELVSEGVVAFTSYNPVRIDYENWCADNGYVALGIGNLRKVLTACGFSRTSTWNTETSKPSNIYKLDSLSADTPLTTLNIGRPGLFTTQGFGHPVVPQQFDSPKADKDKPKPPKSRIREW
jgi:hypothetical protein